MNSKEFELKNGEKRTSLSFENGDLVRSRFNKVGSNEPYAGKKKDGTTFVGQNHYLGVTDLKTNKEVTVTITKGQKASLDKQGDLTGKTLEAYEYVKKSEPNKGKKLVGVRVKSS